MRKSPVVALVSLLLALLALPALATEIPLVRASGVFMVSARLNGVLDLQFVLDSGATEVTIPAEVARQLIRSGTATRDDVLPSANYLLADGRTVEHPRINIRVVEVAGIRVHNVPASIGQDSGMLLLGQSFLERLGTWSLDSRRRLLIVEPELVLQDAPVQAGGDPRVAALLRELALPYQVDPDGDYAMVVPLSEGRTQLLFVNSATKPGPDGRETREVWSPAFQVQEPALPEAIKALADQLLGASPWRELGLWREVPVGRSAFAIFTVTTGAECTAGELSEALEGVSTVADQMERRLTGGDLF